MEMPRFRTGKQATVGAFVADSEKEKGLLTRMKENDPELLK